MGLDECHIRKGTGKYRPNEHDVVCIGYVKGRGVRGSLPSQRYWP